MLDFKGRNVVVTGGASGIGKACVKGIVNGGGFAVILDINAETGKAAVEEFGAEHADFFRFDQGDLNSIQGVFDAIIEKHGRIHAVINNAGIISTESLEEMSIEKWKRVIDINLNGVFACIKAVYPHMKEHKGGRIVNVASIAGKVGGGLLGTIAYASAKSGVMGLTKAVAREGGPDNVCCICVNPGAIYTPMTDHMDPERFEMIRQSVPLGRWGTADECANAILFQASDLASFINGDITECDGGITRD